MVYWKFVCNAQKVVILKTITLWFQLLLQGHNPRLVTGLRYDCIYDSGRIQSFVFKTDKDSDYILTA